MNNCRRFLPLTLARSLTACVLVLALGFLPADAQSELPRGPFVTADLVAEAAQVVPGQPLHVGIRQTIRAGWHTYWRNPGDAGLPTTIDWSLPPGFMPAAIDWPTPLRLEEGPLVVFGYEREVLLPVTIDVPETLKPGADVMLKAHVNWLVCSDTCVPEDAEVSLSLPVTEGPARPDQRWSDVFRSARAALPVRNPFPAEAIADQDAITFRLDSGDAAQLRDVMFLPADNGVIDIDKPQSVRTGGAGLTLILARAPGQSVTPPRLDGVLTFRDLSTGEETPHAIAIFEPVKSVPAAATDGLGLLEAILLAVAGGMVLNLMPCVLPILSIKALSLAAQAQAAPREALKGSLAYAAGVLVSFAVVAGALIAFRAAGVAIGWGFQLQSPVFVTLMIYVLFAVGLNLSGVFTIGSQLANVGGDLATRGGHVGSFFTGSLATLVATPCTAPFMAAAIGYGMVHPWYMSVGVFEAIGAGLALPYVLLAAVPATRRLLPKPGAWMERLKQFLAFPVYGTAVWLAFVLTEESGGAGITLALAGLVLIAFAAWLFETQRHAGPVTRRVATVLATGAVIAALSLPGLAGAGRPAGPAPETATAGPWRPYTQDKLQALLAAGDPVFIDFTADWCITCKVNERVALDNAEVRRAFTDLGIVALKADWTRRSADITRVLEQHGRGGIPLYLFYPKASAGTVAPVVLPQILTPTTVLHVVQNPASGTVP